VCNNWSEPTSDNEAYRWASGRLLAPVPVEVEVKVGKMWSGIDGGGQAEGGDIMAKKVKFRGTSFNFGANLKPRGGKGKGRKGRKGRGKGGASGS
jgi:hypothetical protein